VIRTCRGRWRTVDREGEDGESGSDGGSEVNIGKGELSGELEPSVGSWGESKSEEISDAIYYIQ
jgi:hypothetical protein